MVLSKLVLSMISHKTIPKIVVIARTNVAYEKIYQALYSEPVQLVHLSDEQKCFDTLDDIEAACVLVEVASHPEDELEVIALLQNRNHSRKIIAFSDQWTVSDAVKAIKLGADEVCELQSHVSDLRRMIHRAIADESSKPRGDQDLIPSGILELLQADEAKILHLIARGLTAKEIGVALDVSIRTYHYRKKSIFQKLGVANRSEMIELIRTMAGRRIEWPHPAACRVPPKFLRDHQVAEELDYA
jgi:DNA-binding NarL/FixJ family response regulator